MNDLGSQTLAPAVSVIVPVYKNISVTRNCVESLGSEPKPDDTIVTLILDGSPEPDLVLYCQEAADQFGFDIIVNTKNQGFVKTANEGMRLHPDADVVLLNSDTVVSGLWLERLQSCAYRKDTIGTVTPFSNNGTICSYPVFPSANALPPSWSASALDDVVRMANTDQQHQIPTAVGFCMYVKRQCLIQVGLFDEENFGLGYGEECDFSLRASKLGWEHMLAADVFVFHEGGASFSSESEQRKGAADTIMARLHPDYDALVTSFIHSDPMQHLRTRIDQQRILERPTDVSQVLIERAEQATLLRETLIRERENTEQVVAQLRKLEALLTEARAKFQTADASLEKTQTTLNEAHSAVDTLAETLTNTQNEAKDLYDKTQELASEIDTLGEQLYLSRDENKALKERVDQIHASKSWRYTKWMRRE